MRQRVRRSAAALTLAFAGSAAALLSGGASAEAAPPIVVGSCATSVQGTPGQPVSLSSGAVVGVVVDAVRAVPLLGPPLASAAGGAVSALPPIPIGTIPTGPTGPTGSGFISGATIANAVTTQLRTIPLLGPVIGAVVGSVQATLTSTCGISVTGVNAATAPVQDGAKAVAGASQQATGTLPGTVPGATGGTPGGGGTGATGGGTAPAGSPGAGTAPGANQPVLGGAPASELDFSQFLTGRSPMADYSSIPFARAGLFSPSPGVRYGGAVSGYTPQFGILGAGDPDGVTAAGDARALHPPAVATIALPVLLAVFLLSGVTAVLVRTWVLRRSSVA